MPRLELPEAYRFDAASACWLHLLPRPEFNYSDGDEVESRLLDIIRAATDLRAVSAELRRHISDWPSRYHLSPARGNLLRPLEHLLRGCTLEIGAGCGAITRFIAECGGEVHALEGSLRRAEIAALRCRDLANVRVVSDAFHRFPVCAQYDTVTLIGVLEYARKYFPTDGGDPVDALLRHARRFLRPGGVLIVAIENQLGLKYFAGYGEDHFGLPMYGIEDHYEAGGIVTFGRDELAARLATAGLTTQQWWYPFPDYKTPVLLLAEEALVDAGRIDFLPVLCSALAVDPQKPATPRFRLERAWYPVLRNRCGPALANSFLVVASDADAPPGPQRAIGYHYAVERRREFNKQVVFARGADGNIEVRQELLYPATPVAAGSPISLHLESEPFVRGEQWQQRINQIMTRRGWSAGDLQVWAAVWFEALLLKAGLPVANEPVSVRTLLPGRFVDAIPRNLIVDPEGGARFIDQEWHLRAPVEIGYLLFRGVLLYTLLSMDAIAPPAPGTAVKAIDLFTQIAAALGIAVGGSDIERYAAQEREFQLWSGDIEFASINEYVNARSLNILDTLKFEPPANAAIEHLEADSRMQLARIDTLEEALAERAASVAGLAASAAELSHERDRLSGLLAEREVGRARDEASMASERRRIATLERVLDETLREKGVLAASVADRDGRITAQESDITSCRTHIEELEFSAHERESRVAMLSAAARQGEAQAELFKHTVAEREATIAALGRTVLERETSIAQLTATTAHSQAEIDRLERGAAAQDARIADFSTSLAAREEQVAGLTRTLAQRALEMAALDRTLIQREDLIAQLSAAARRDQAQADQLESGAVAQQARIADFSASLAAREEQVAGLTQALAQRAAVIEALDRTVIDREGSIAELTQARLACEAQIAQLGRQIATLAAHVEGMESSNSWRATAPLRFMRRVLLTRPNWYARKWLSDGARSGWHGLPLAPEKKQALKGAVFRNLPSVFGRTLAYRSWFDFTAQMAPAAEPFTVQALVPDIVQAPMPPTTPKGEEYVPLLQATSPAARPARIVCFYLPQFHPIPENDDWWGKGFTEWVNVRQAQPQFVGHYQPRVPAELGYYDLLDRKTMQRQVELAQQYGIGGFCFYFYWFAAKRLLETPLLRYLEDATLDLPFCLCWANENWTRRWDGLESEILIGQAYSPEDDIAFIAHVAQYLKDPRYIRVDGKPLLIVYRPSLLPDSQATTRRWRDWCVSHGIGEIHLACTQSFGFDPPGKFGFDAAIEFPPNNAGPPNITGEVLPLVPEFASSVYDWRIFIERSRAYRDADYTLYRGVNPAWDNSARRKRGASVLQHSSPRGYQEWLLNAIGDTCRRFATADQRLVFVNAWNEWAEGAYLEPDQRHGYAYLEATRLALLRRQIIDAPAAGAAASPLAIVIHAFYEEVFKEILDYLGQLRAASFRLYVTCPPDRMESVGDRLAASGYGYSLLPVANRGRDVLPFLRILPQVVAAGHEFLIKVHTKKSTHRVDGDVWRSDLFNKLLGDVAVGEALACLRNSPGIGILGPAGHVVPMSFYWGSNAATVERVASRLGIEQAALGRLQFVAGTMFFARAKALLPLMNLALGEDDFEEERGQVDGTLAHALERLMAVSAHSVALETIAAGGEAQADYPYADRTADHAPGSA